MADIAPYLLRLALYLLLMLLFGGRLYGGLRFGGPLLAGPRFSRIPLDRGRPALPTLGRRYRAAIALALLLVGVDAVARLCSMLGMGAAQLDGETLHWYFGQTPMGIAGAVRAAALLLLLAVALRRQPPGRVQHATALLASAIALASLAWNGHAAAGDGLSGALRLSAGILHLLAAGAWVGAIATLLARAATPHGPGLRQRGRELFTALHAFALPGTVIVAVLAVTGSITYLDLGGTPATLLHTAHGRWLLLKLAAVGGMLVLAALHRWRLVPALAVALDTTASDATAVPAPWRQLRRSLACEAALAVLVLACVAVLGTLDPLS